MAYYNDPYSYDPYSYDPYGYENAWQDPNLGYWQGDEEYQEETESQKLRKEQEMIEAIESNRLYLRKVRRKCVQEDFVNLEKTQMFLFEFLIETLEVNTRSDLGLVSETQETSELVARVQFLDNPYLEIREKGEKTEESDSVRGQTEYFSTVGNAGLQDSIDPGKTVRVNDSLHTGSNEEPTKEVSNGDQESIIQFDTKWENSTGKSLLFSKTALEIIQELDKTPVKVQVSMCVESTEEGSKGTCEPLGYALVHLPDHFNLSILQSCKSGVILPVSCVHRDTCNLKNVFGVIKGELQVFVRLSCFGSVITTSFRSVGPERQYVFKPSPLPDLKGEEENEDKRDLVLKPIVAEEEVAIGITVFKDGDPFQKTVLWKNNPQNCECLVMDSDPVQFTESSLRMPRPSDVSLCRDAKTCKQVGKPFCQWHNLVTKEIKNNPGGNCGCLDNMKIIKSPLKSKELGLSSPPNSKKPSKFSESSLGTKQIIPKVSRVEKMMLNTKYQSMVEKVPEKKIEPIKGLGLKPEPTDCNCDCRQIRNILDMNPMMKYTWQIK